MQFQAEDPSIIYRVADAPSRLLRRGVLPLGIGASKKGRYSVLVLITAWAVRAIFAVTAVSALRLRSAIFAIPGDVTLELGAKAVVALADGDLRRDPEGPAQPGIAEFGQPGLAAELA